MLSSWKPRLLTAAALVALAGASASAQETDVLTVQVTVQESCSIEGSTIDFGTYSAGQQAALNAEGTIRYNNCAAGTLTVSLDGGTAGDVSNRAMGNGNGDLLRYQLYTLSNRNTVWGTGEQALQRVLTVAGSDTLPVYGTIFGGQIVPGGSYTDTVNVTLTF